MAKIKHSAPLFLLWERFCVDLMANTRRFPVTFRYHLAHMINTLCLSILSDLAVVEFCSQSERMVRLKEIDQSLTRLKVLVRQAMLQKALTYKGYVRHQATLDEAGRMIGGWLKSLTSSQEVI